MSRPTATPLPRLLTVAEAADHLGTSTSRLAWLLSSGRIIAPLTHADGVAGRRWTRR